MRLKTGARLVLFCLALFGVFDGLVFSETPTPTPVTQAVAPQSKGDWDWEKFSQAPVHIAGRYKPLDTYLREVALYVTGSRKFQGWEPTEMLLSWITQPHLWDDVPFIQVGLQEVRKQIGLDLSRTRFSPRELIAGSELAQYAERMSTPGGVAAFMAKPPVAGGAPKEDPREKELKQVLDRLGAYRSIITGQGWPIVPRRSPEAWGTVSAEEFSGMNLDPAQFEKEQPVREAFARVVKAYLAGDRTEFEAGGDEYSNRVLAQLPEGEGALIRGPLKAELFYNYVRPFFLSWVFYLIAALAGAAVLAIPTEAVSSISRQIRAALQTTLGLGVALGFILHIAGMALRIWIAGRPPVSNMYESVIWVSFGVVLFAIILFVRQKQVILPTVAAAVAAVLLIVADSAPAVMDPSIHPLVPVLRSNFWLLIHVLTITLGYSAFALSLGISNVTLFQYLKREVVGLSARVANLNQLNYRAMQFGVVLLAAGTILGGVWADYSWGRFWGWDPKEVWALIALMGYIIILHARYTGWMGQFGFAVWSVIGFSLVVMAWYGVNFVLGVGLHSYGFSTGGRAGVALMVGTQLAYVAGVYAIKRLRDRKGSPAAT